MYQVKLETGGVEWTSVDFVGVAMKRLREDGRTGGMTVMTRMEAGAAIPAHRHSRADETVFVVEGDFIEDGVAYGPGSFFVGEAGTVHGPHGSAGGCVLLTTFSGPLDFLMEG